MSLSLAIATNTWIRTNEERHLVLNTLEALNELGVPIIIVDRSSLEDKERIKRLRNVSIFESSSLTQQVLLAQRESAKVADFIFYLQSDKQDFAENTAYLMVEEYKKLSTKGMFIPVRTKESRQSYPAFQRSQEEFLNIFISDYIGIENDYFAGPKIYPSTLVNYLSQLKGKIGWGMESFYYVLAKRLNMSFDFFECNIKAPKDVDNERETHNYRLEITKWQLDGFLQAQEVIL
jgi:hypothetical protein